MKNILITLAAAGVFAGVGFFAGGMSATGGAIQRQNYAMLGGAVGFGAGLIVGFAVASKLGAKNK